MRLHRCFPRTASYSFRVCSFLRQICLRDLKMHSLQPMSPSRRLSHPSRPSKMSLLIWRLRLTKHKSPPQSSSTTPKVKSMPPSLLTKPKCKPSTMLRKPRPSNTRECTKPLDLRVKKNCWHTSKSRLSIASTQRIWW